MRIHVRRHIRVTASGKHASVRAYEREGDDGQREVPGWVRPSYVGDEPVTETAVTEDFWDDDAEDELECRLAGFRADAAALALKDAEDKAAARREYREARAELERIGDRDRYESDEFLAANRRVIAAERNVSWWRR